MARSVLDTVLDQLHTTPEEYFQRLSESLEEAREQRLHRASSSRETDALIQEEVAGPPAFSMIGAGIEEPEAFPFGEAPLDEEGEAPAATTPAAAARARAKKAARPRVHAAEEEEDELAEFGLEPLDEDETQFGRAYRRALRTNRRPFRPER